MVEYGNINGLQTRDIGTALQHLIDDNIKKLNTIFLARIIKITDNKISISPAIKKKSTDKTLIINNCMIGFMRSGNWQEQIKVSIGDIGIAIVIDNDITQYKNNGIAGTAETKRVRNIQDSIFIPLSMFATLPNDSINYILQNMGGSCSLEFDNDENVILKAKLLTLQSETTTLKALLSDLGTILEGALINQSSSGTQPFAPSTITQFANWKNSLDTLFKD